MEINNNSNFTSKFFSIAKNIINQNLELNTTEDSSQAELLQNNLELSLTQDENLKLILSTLGASPSEKNLSLVKLLINSNLPVNKQNLKDYSANLKLFNELPMEKLEFLLKNNLQPNKDNASLIESYISKEIKLNNQINEIFINIDNSSDLENVIKIFTNNKNLSNLSKFIFNNLSNIKNKIVSKLLESPEIFKEILTNLEILKNLNIKENTNSKTLINNTAKNNLIFENLINENATNENILPEKLIENILSNKFIFDKTHISLFKNKIEQAFYSNTNKLDMNKTNTNIKPEQIEDNILRLIFKDFNIKELKDFMSTTLKFQSKLNEKTSFDFKKSDSKDLTEFLANIKENVNLSKSILKQDEINKFSKLQQTLEEINKNIDFMSSLKDTTFLQIPLNINNNQTNAELYIFKDKNSKKINNKNSGSALLSLNLANLGLVETYINKLENCISCEFRINDNNVKKLIKENIEILKFYLKEKNLILKNISFKEINESFSLISKEPNNYQDNFNINLKSFDKKA